MRFMNSVAVLALVAAAVLPPPVLAQDDPVAEDLESIVDSLSDPAVPDDVAALPEEELLTDEELDELVAPVALYPDALLAQVLVAATYPLQIVKADRIILASEDMTDEELSETLSQQEFDPSVLVLTSGFPTVIERMALDLDWTEQLGIAMLQQDDDVLAAVQRMRADARDMGYLSSNDAQIIEEDAGEIYIAPADPEVVYVPTYDPSVVYTSPAPAEPYYVAPAQSTSPWSAQSLLTGGVIGFGSALLINELWGDDDDDDDDWDGYWRRPRPISWEDREFYPRPYWNRNRAEQARAWSWERDRYWRRDDNDNRWRREVARDRREAALDRREALGYMGDPARVRAARERGHWRALEEERRDDARQQRLRQELRQERETSERRRERLQEESREDRAPEERRQERQQQQLREERETSERRQQRLREERREDRAAEEQRQERQQRQLREERREDREAAEQRDRRRDEAAAEQQRSERRAAERQQQERQEAARQREERAKAEAERQRRDRDQAADEQRQRQRAEQQQRQRQQGEQRQRASGGEQQQDGGQGRQGQRRCREGDNRKACQ